MCGASVCITATNWAPYGQTHEKYRKSAKSEEHPYLSGHLIYLLANAKVMSGPYLSVAGLREWSSKKKTRGFPVERVSMIDEFYRLNKFVTLAVGVMFVTKIHFLSLIGRRSNS